MCICSLGAFPSGLAAHLEHEVPTLLGPDRCWTPQAATPHGYHCFFLCGARAAPVPAPSPDASLCCFTVCWSGRSGSRVPRAEPGRTTRRRKRGRCPQAGLTLTRCETSGYNTGPGRCSDPSCLVLQPEGRRSAAERAPSLLDSKRRDRAGKARPGRKVGAVP